MIQKYALSTLVLCWLVAAATANARSDLRDAQKGVPPQVWEQVQKLVPFHGAGGDQFGISVDIDGDTAVVGAQFVDESESVLDVGAVCIFERNQGGPDNWGEVKQLFGSGTADSGFHSIFFGGSVSISGDTVVVGAHAESAGAFGTAGAVYVFARDQGGPDNWGQVKRITASDASAGARFGRSVGISGDTIVVGTQTPNGTNPLSAIYVFDRDHGGPDNWGEVRKRNASDAHVFDDFGFSVDIDGDTIVVGSFSNIADGVTYGAVYTFDRDYGGPDNWGQVRKMLASDRMPSDNLGYSVGISGNTIVAGARFGEGPATNSGTAYVFERNQGGPSNWGEVKKLVASDAEELDRFGKSVAISGNNIIVGARFEDDVCPADPDCDSGAAYIYQRNRGGANNWGEVTKLTATWDADEGDSFGFSVAIDGNTTVVGAHLNDDAGDASGSAYAYEQTIVAADLAVVQTDSADPVIAGSQLAYSVTVSNAGPVDAEDVVVTDLLPSGTTLVLTNGCAEDPTAVPTCTLGTIPAGGDATFVVLVQVNSGTTGLITNEVTVTSSTPEHAPGNETAIETTQVVGPLGVIFQDGFESGDTLAWSSTVP